MISESDPWKIELKRLARVIATMKAGDSSGAQGDFDVERSMLYSATIVRKLIESRKVTDILRERKYDVYHLARRAEREESIMFHLMQSDIELEFCVEVKVVQRMSAWEICSEIIHSGFVLYNTDECDRMLEIYVSSIRNKSSRLVCIPIEIYTSILDDIVLDKVKFVHLSFDEDGAFKRKSS